MSEFDFLYDNIDFNSTEVIKGKVIKQSVKQSNLLLSRFEEIKKILPEIKENETAHLISSDNFGSIELLKVLTENKVDELIITTWSINQDFIDYIKTLDCKIFIFVDKSLKTRKIHLYSQLAELALSKKIQLKIHHMLHSKVTLIKNKEDYYSIEASANYSKNQRIENFTITNSIELFNFHKEWMFKLIGN